jgi:hypothetical protein
VRAPERLSPDELASLKILWEVYPDEVVMRPDRDHSKLDDLVRSGYVERIDRGEIGTGYRLAAVHAADLARLVAQNAEQAEKN